MNCVGEEWLGTLDPGPRILCFASMLRVFTLGQAARYAWQGDVRAARKALEKFVWQRRWLNIVKNFPLPRECGGGTTDVYYLTLAGINALKKVAPKLALYARKKQPRGALRNRIPHDLLITEAYLWIHERFLILEFIPEEALKSQLRKNGGRWGEGQYPNINSEATGDFKVNVVKRGGDGGARWVECEVSLHLDAGQISRKPDGMAWFTASRQQADIIETNKKRKPIILESVARPSLAEARDKLATIPTADREQDEETARRVQQGKYTGTLTEAHQRVLRALDLLGGCATAEAIAGVLGGERSGVSRSLKELETAGETRREDVQFRPGRERGRPRGLYVHARTKPLSLGARINRLMLSQVVVASTSCGFSVHVYDAATSMVELRHGTSLSEPPLIVVVDDPEVAVKELSKRLTSTRSRFVTGKGTVVVAMVSDERMTELYKLDPRAKIYDVTRRFARVESRPDG